MAGKRIDRILDGLWDQNFIVLLNSMQHNSSLHLTVQKEQRSS
jgi:hypothetical protein